MNRRELSALRLQLNNVAARLKRVSLAQMETCTAKQALAPLKDSANTLIASRALARALEALEAERVWLRDEDTRLLTEVAQAERELGVIRTVRLVRAKDTVDLGEVGPVTWVPADGGPTQVLGPDGEWVKVDI